MAFAFSLDLRHIVLLLKPNDHKNPLFRGNWTVPGGLIENDETERMAVAREFREEAGVSVLPGDWRPVLTFLCNCDETEAEHEVLLFASTLSDQQMGEIWGDQREPVYVFEVANMPDRRLWYLDPLMVLVLGRLRQPTLQVSK